MDFYISHVLNGKKLKNFIGIRIENEKERSNQKVGEV